MAAWAAMAAISAVPWLGWVQTGAAVRNSYEIFRSAQRLGLEELTPLRVVWFLIPVLALTAAVFGAFGRHRWCGALAVVLGLIVGGAGLVVALSSVGADAGPWAALAAGAGAVIIGIWVAREPQEHPNR